MADGLMPPRMLLEKVVTQSQAIGTVAPEQSSFIHPFDKFPDSVPEADRKRLREAAIAAIRDSVNPAYAKFTAFVRDEYAPKGRTEPGIWSLPDRGERYAFRVKESTTTKVRVTALSRHNAPARAASATPQIVNAASTTHRGAAPTLRNRKGKKFHVVMCT